MRKLLSIAIMFGCHFASAQITFKKAYGADTLVEEGNAVVQAADSGYYVAGYRVSYTSYIYKATLLRTDKYGNELWTKNYSMTGAKLAFDHIAKTADGNFIVTGMAYYGINDQDVYLAKIDTAGTVLWEKNLGGPNVQRGLSVKETYDNGFIVSGYSDSMGIGSGFYVIKTDSIGDSLWSKSYDHGLEQYGQSISQTSDSGYIISGSSTPQGQIVGRPYIIKTNPLGDTLWTRFIGTVNTGQALDVYAINNNHSVVAGYSGPPGVTSPKPFLTELDALGNTVWYQTYNDGPNGSGYSVDRTTDGGYVLAGRDTSGNFYIVKTNSTGNQQWFRKVDMTSSDWAYCISQTSDGGYVFSGSAIDDSTNFSNIALVKLDGNGDILAVPASAINANELLVYPNPARDRVYIQNRTGEPLLSVQLYDVMGRLLRSYPCNQASVSMSGWSKGMYILRLHTSTGIVNTKLLVE